MRLLIACFFVGSSACTLLPIPVTTTAMMDDKDPPPKIVVSDYEIPYYTNRNRLAWWSEEPQWGNVKMTRGDSGWKKSRASTNLPLVRVLIDDTLTGKKCRWSSVRLLQVDSASDKSDRDMSGVTETLIDTDFVDDQFAGDCAQIKQTIIDDPHYSSVIAKD